MFLSAFHGHLDAINLLSSKCLHLLNTSDSTGSTPLHESVKQTDSNITRRLIELGANAHATNNIGQNILHVSAIVGNKNVIQYILQNNIIEVECSDKQGLTPLTAAQRNKFHEVVKILEKYISRHVTSS